MVRTNTQRIDDEGYLTYTTKDTEGGCKSKGKLVPRKSWWLGKKEMNIVINGLPERYWGQRIRVKVEIMDEVVNQELID